MCRRFTWGPLHATLLWVVSLDRTRITFRRELWRSVSAGIVDTAANTFLLLIAVRNFEAGALLKASIAGGSSIGLLLSPAFVSLAQNRRWAPTRAVAACLAFGSIASLVAVFTPTTFPFLYMLAGVMALASATISIPLMTQVYQDNYPPANRGRYYSRTVMLRIGAAIIFGALAGPFLDPHPKTYEVFLGSHAPAVVAWLESQGERFRVLLLLFGVALASGARAVSGIPSEPLSPSGAANPLHALRYIRTDATFRNTLIAWMLMGFANLGMLPLRIEYLGNPKFGLALSAAEIAVLTIVLPNLARILLSPVWGWLFDRMNFFTMRITLNIGFALGIAAFFTSTTWTGLMVGSVFYGISTAGGDVAWGLWVTKITTPDRVADYMGIHTFFTGIRGILAPIVAFQAIQIWPPVTLGAAAGGIIVLSSVLLIPEMMASARERRR